MPHIRQIRPLRQKRKFDFMLVVMTVLFCFFGILMIYEASNVSAFHDFSDKYHYVRDQFVWFIIGSSAMLTTFLIPYKKFYYWSLAFIIGTIFALAAVFIPGIGIKVLGAHRWIGFGIYSIQPAEFAKVAMILYLSAWFSTREKNRLGAFLLLSGLLIGLVILEPDLGTAIILTCIAITMYFLSEAPIWHFIALIPVIISGVFGLAVTSPYRFKRITTFLNPSADPLGASYHIRQILIALGSGGLFGLGLGASRQKYQFLPEATTDSIFAIIGEEFGLMGTVILLSVFMYFLYRIFRIAKNASDRHGQLMAGGILMFFACHIAINLGSMVALVPLTGVPLPFISYGGSNLIVSLALLGIVLNISKSTAES